MKRKKEGILTPKERGMVAGWFVRALKRMPFPKGSEHKRRRGKRRG